MIIFDKQNKKVKAQKVYKRPRFNSRFGKTWQWGTMVLNGKDVNYTYDNTWGSWWYFCFENVWYKANILESYEPHWRMEFATEMKEEKNDQKDSA